MATEKKTKKTPPQKKSDEIGTTENHSSGTRPGTEENHSSSIPGGDENHSSSEPSK